MDPPPRRHDHKTQRRRKRSKTLGTKVIPRGLVASHRHSFIISPSYQLRTSARHHWSPNLFKTSLPGLLHDIHFEHRCQDFSTTNEFYETSLPGPLLQDIVASFYKASLLGSLLQDIRLPRPLLQDFNARTICTFTYVISNAKILWQSPQTLYRTGPLSSFVVLMATQCSEENEKPEHSHSFVDIMNIRYISLCKRAAYFTMDAGHLHYIGEKVKQRPHTRCAKQRRTAETDTDNTWHRSSREG